MQSDWEYKKFSSLDDLRDFVNDSNVTDWKFTYAEGNLFRYYILFYTLKEEDNEDNDF